MHASSAPSTEHAREPQAAGPVAQFSKRSALATLVYTDGVFTVRVAGPVVGDREAGILDLEIAHGLRHAGARLRSLVLDLSDVEELSSAGIGLCVRARRDAAAGGGSAIIVGLRPPLRERLRAATLDARGAVDGPATEAHRRAA